VVLHGLGEVTADRSRHEVVDLSGAGEVVERAAKGTLGDLLTQFELLGDGSERLVEDGR
jgi:hypothetical protein